MPCVTRAVMPCDVESTSKSADSRRSRRCRDGRRQPSTVSWDEPYRVKQREVRAAVAKTVMAVASVSHSARPKCPVMQPSRAPKCRCAVARRRETGECLATATPAARQVGCRRIGR